MLSQAVEDYLKAIYKLQDGGPVGTSDLARAMNVSSASVTNMAKRLATMGLVEHQSYRGVTLTDDGERIALEVIRHHRLLETYLKEVMGYSWAMIHEEAEHLEHHISEEFERRIDEMLGYPTHDPHGDPIPTLDGQIDRQPVQPLADADAGHAFTIQRVSDDDPELLHYLEEIGLLPRTDVHILEKAPFNGPLTVRIGEQQQVVGYEVACQVFVNVDGTGE